MMRAANGVRRRCCLVLVAMAYLFACTSVASAHPVPAARAVLDLQASNRYELSIACDVSALVMQTTPGHLGQAAEELQALSATELQARIDDTQQAIKYYLDLKFDGVRQKSLSVEMPPIDVIRNGAAHGGEEAWPEIIARGFWPADAKTCEITFPAALGRVNLSIARIDTRLLRRDLDAGQASGPISLSKPHTPSPRKHHPLTDWIGWILVALILAYLVRLFLGRPKYPAEPYSRSTNTGQ